MINEYETFFRNGGYRVMRLLVIKAERELDFNEENLDATALLRLQHAGEAAPDFARRRAMQEVCRISDIYDLDWALGGLLESLPRNWGAVIESHFGRGEPTRSSGTGIRKRTAENALAGALRKIEQSCGPGVGSGYDFAVEGLDAVRKIMSYINRATDTEEDPSESLLMKAVMSMKLFRDGRQGINYNEALYEFCEKAGGEMYQYAGASGRDKLMEDLFIMQEIRDDQPRTNLERKVREGCSSILIDRMVELSAIMGAIHEYMPDKYERIMSFHWTHSEEKLTELFFEVAALLASVE